MTAADEPEAHGAVDRCCAWNGGHEPAAGVGQVRILHALWRPGAKPDDAVFGLEKYMGVLGQIIGDHARQTDAEIDEGPRFDFRGDAAGDDFFCVHQAALARR